MRPANGSASVLKTKSETGSESAIFRSTVSPLWSGALVARGLPARGGRGENLGQEIQDGVAPDIVQRGAEQHRENALCRAPPRAGLFSNPPRAACPCRKIPASIRRRLRRPFPPASSCAALACFGQLGGNFLDLGFAVAIGRIDQRLHRDEIHHAAKLFLLADGQLDRHGAAAEHLLAASPARAQSWPARGPSSSARTRAADRIRWRSPTLFR